MIKPAFKPITLLLRQIQGATRRVTEEALRESKLTAAQANVLTELAYGQPVECGTGSPLFGNSAEHG